MGGRSQERMHPTQALSRQLTSFVDKLRPPPREPVEKLPEAEGDDVADGISPSLAPDSMPPSASEVDTAGDKSHQKGIHDRDTNRGCDQSSAPQYTDDSMGDTGGACIDNVIFEEDSV